MATRSLTPSRQSPPQFTHRRAVHGVGTARAWGSRPRPGEDTHIIGGGPGRDGHVEVHALSGLDLVGTPGDDLARLRSGGIVTADSTRTSRAATPQMLVMYPSMSVPPGAAVSPSTGSEVLSPADDGGWRFPGRQVAGVVTVAQPPKVAHSRAVHVLCHHSCITRGLLLDPRDRRGGSRSADPSPPPQLSRENLRDHPGAFFPSRIARATTYSATMAEVTGSSPVSSTIPVPDCSVTRTRLPAARQHRLRAVSVWAADQGRLGPRGAPSAASPSTRSDRHTFPS